MPSCMPRAAGRLEEHDREPLVRRARTGGSPSRPTTEPMLPAHEGEENAP